MTIHIMILRTSGTKFFAHDKGPECRWWVLNFIPGKLGIYLQIGESRSE